MYIFSGQSWLPVFITERFESLELPGKINTVVSDNSVNAPLCFIVFLIFFIGIYLSISSILGSLSY